MSVGGPDRRRPDALVWLTAVAAGGAAAMYGAPAAAHAFAERYDLPLPLWLYVTGGGAAVAVSFAALALVPRGRTDAELRPRPIVRIDGPVVRGAVAAVRAVSVLLLILLIDTGLRGNQDDPFANLLPTFVWVIWWVGVAYLSALAGDVWAVVNPFAALGRGAGRLRRLAAGAAWQPPVRLPERVGVWPAVVLFLAFAWAELVWPDRTLPDRLALAVLSYTAVTLGAMALVGVEPWLRRGEVFALLFGLFARFAPLAVTRDGGGRARLAVRPYAAGLLDRAPASPSLAAFVIVVLSTVSFDGFAETPAWRAATVWATGVLYEAGAVEALTYEGTRNLLRTVGLLATPCVFAAVYFGIATLIARLGGGLTAGRAARHFVLSLVPIAIAYHLAHYLSLFAIYGQQIVPLASDPYGIGWDLFGTAGAQRDIAVLGARTVWIAAVTAIVLGHVAAVWVGHRTALALFGDRPRAVLSQLPMLALMVGYTMSSLWILSQPIVEG